MNIWISFYYYLHAFWNTNGKYMQWKTIERNCDTKNKMKMKMPLKETDKQENYQPKNIVKNKRGAQSQSRFRRDSNKAHEGRSPSVPVIRSDDRVRFRRVLHGGRSGKASLADPGARCHRRPRRLPRSGCIPIFGFIC